MSVDKMHEGEVETDAGLARRLLASQFPQWAGLPIERAASSGTDNALYRLGDDLVVRLSRIDWAVGQVEKEGVWLPRLAPFLPLAVPGQAAVGEPEAATAVWESALNAAEWEREPVWFHGDLLPGNLLFDGGRLTAVIDFGGLGVGDPAPDLMIAWGLFAGESRAAFRAALGVDEATWLRGRGHALSQAVIFIPYYLETNPVGVGYAQRAVEAVLADFRENG